MTKTEHLEINSYMVFSNNLSKLCFMHLLKQDF